MEYQYQTVSAQLFASPVATMILGSTLQEVCHSRMVFSRDLLILLCVLKYCRIQEVCVLQCSPQTNLKAWLVGVVWAELMTSMVIAEPYCQHQSYISIEGWHVLCMLKRTLVL